jgi:hypothetical protein
MDGAKRDAINLIYKIYLLAEVLWRSGGRSFRGNIGLDEYE